MIGILGWFLTPTGTIVGGILALFVAWRGHLLIYGQQKIAEGQAIAGAKIEKANANATDQGKRAAQRSRDGSVRGPIDPTTRHD